MLENLNFIDQDYEEMQNTLIKWSEINTHAYNLEGLEKFKQSFLNKVQNLEKELNLKLKVEELELKAHETLDEKGRPNQSKLGKALRITKQGSSNNPHILLMGHMDTVFPIDSHFQKTKLIDKDTLNGPGVADLKGGLVAMLKAIEAFEKSEYRDQLNWQIFINPDEEIGSPGSSEIFSKLAAENDLALIYEPSLSDGSIAWQRKGAGNFQLVVNGKAAHVGREFSQGASAIKAVSDFIQEANQLNSPEENIIINFGKISGGGPLNVVPELTQLGINIRVSTEEDLNKTENFLQKAVAKINQTQNIKAKLYGQFNRKPKIPNKNLENLYELMNSCARDLKLELKQRNTGGCCDGNNLYEHGLVNLDTLGVRGGKIHSDEEFICLPSLVERAKLSAYFMMRLAKEGLKIIQ